MTDVPVYETDADITVVATTDGQVVFAFDFRADETDYIQATHIALDGVETPLVADTDFTVTGVGDEDGGTIDITLSGITTVEDETIRIYRLIPIERLNDYSIELRAEPLNEEFDLIFMIMQELNREVGRAYKAKFGLPGKRIDAIPAGHIHQTDADGNLIDGGELGDLITVGGAEGVYPRIEVANDFSVLATHFGVQIAAIDAGTSQQTVVTFGAAAGYHEVHWCLIRNEKIVRGVRIEVGDGIAWWLRPGMTARVYRAGTVWKVEQPIRHRKQVQGPTIYYAGKEAVADDFYNDGLGIDNLITAQEAYDRYCADVDSPAGLSALGGRILLVPDDYTTGAPNSSTPTDFGELHISGMAAGHFNHQNVSIQAMTGITDNAICKFVRKVDSLQAAAAVIAECTVEIMNVTFDNGGAAGRDCVYVVSRAIAYLHQCRYAGATGRAAVFCDRTASVRIAGPTRPGMVMAMASVGARLWAGIGGVIIEDDITGAANIFYETNCAYTVANVYAGGGDISSVNRSANVNGKTVTGKRFASNGGGRIYTGLTGTGAGSYYEGDAPGESYYGFYDGNRDEYPVAAFVAASTLDLTDRFLDRITVAGTGSEVVSVITARRNRRYAVTVTGPFILKHTTNTLEMPGGKSRYLTTGDTMTWATDSAGNVKVTAISSPRAPQLGSLVSWAGGSIANGAQVSLAVTIPGINSSRGRHRVVAVCGSTLAGLRLWAEDTATDTVTLYLANFTGSTVVHAAANFTIFVEDFLASFGAVWDAGAVAHNAQTSQTFTVPGAAVGDRVFITADIALGGMRLWGEVTAADTVTAYLRNVTGGSVNLASAKYYIEVTKAPKSIAFAIDFASTATAAQSSGSTGATINGVLVGYRSYVTCSVDLQALEVWAEATATGTITVYSANHTGGTIDPASKNYTIWAEPT